MTTGRTKTERAWTPTPHPRLFFGPDDCAALRAKRSIDPIASSAWERVAGDREAAMALPMPRWSDRWEWDSGSDGQKNIGTMTGECRRAVFSLGLSWLLDGEKAHARKATDILMAMCDFDFWTSTRYFGTNYAIPWRGTLENAGICHLMACGYDWLYDFMTEAERHRLRTCLLYKGILPLVQDWADPLTRLPLSTHIKPWGNWWQNCIAPAGEATMALYGEHPLTERFARLCKEGSDWFFRFEGASVPEMPQKQLASGDTVGTYYAPNFDSAGGYSEGLNYLDGPLWNSFYFAESYRRQVGQEILPLGLMKKVCDFILDGTFRMGDRMRAANFGDCRAGHATLPMITAYLARRLRHPGIQWFLHNSQNNLNDASLVRFAEEPVFTFLWYDPALEPKEPAKPAAVKVYPGVGWAVIRSGWGHEDSMLVLKSGPTAPHCHADAGSFVLYSRDELLLIDSGVCGYEMPEYRGYYHTSHAHSTVLVGREGQIQRLAGRIVEQAGVAGLGFALADATAPYEGRLAKFIRGILFVGNEYYIVFDQLAKKTDAPFHWLLHYDGEMKREADGYVIRKNGAGVLVKLIEPAEHNCAIKQGYKTYHEELYLVKSSQEKQRELERGEYLSITAARNLNRQQYFTVLYPFEATASVPQVEVVRSAGWIAIRATRQSETDLIGLRRIGTRAAKPIDGIETDADFFCVTFNAKQRPVRALMQNGSYLKSHKDKLLSSRKRTTLAVKL